MTSTGKTLLGIVILIILAIVIWSVSRKPADMTPVTGTPASTDTTTTAGSSTEAGAISGRDNSDASIDQDMSSINAQMNAYNSDSSAAAQ